MKDRFHPGYRALMTRFYPDRRDVRLLLAGKVVGTLHVSDYSCTAFGGTLELQTTDNGVRQVFERIVEIDRVAILAVQNNDPSSQHLFDEHRTACMEVVDRVLTVDGTQVRITDFLLYEDWSVEIRPHV